jgi:hypothetical protein
MNHLTMRQRKLVYLVGIVMLLIPIIWLGRPAGGATDDSESGNVSSSGGHLSQLRQQYDLDESTFGNVDPSSATMNLVLLGMRGLAVNQLWMQADHQKETKNWAELRSTVDSIILLQPHFLKVWRFQGWNLAYNVSSSWDALEDRYYWVKEGGKFYMDGTQRNRRYTELYWEIGRILGNKVGRSDEWRYFRQYFKSDPDKDQFPKNRNNGQDKAFAWADGHQFDDNYLAAKHWFRKANESERRHEQHIMMRMLFRFYPSHAQIEYANAMHREGEFGERARREWVEAYRELTQVFGKEEFYQWGGRVKLEATDAEVLLLAKQEGVSVQQKLAEIISYQSQANYRYWRARCEFESEGKAAEAHTRIYNGRAMYRKGQTNPTHVTATGNACDQVDDEQTTPAEKAVLKLLCASKTFVERESLLEDPAITDDLLEDMQAKKSIRFASPAQIELEKGMKAYAEMIERYPDLETDDTAVEEGMLAVLYWRRNYLLFGDEADIPESYPLKTLWVKYKSRLEALERVFQRELAAGK